MIGIQVYIDGGARGNPGPAGGGFAVYQNGKAVMKGSEYFGEKTNNQAEYLALRLALREVYSKFGDGDLELNCFMDSQLVVEQMNGNYKVKNANIKPLFQEVRRIADQFKSFTISHVPREENALADQLANQAMDRG
ncbi:ribonuclease HI family protein [Candidatus Peregrinibacteria bacterium]|nr:ribonuclease HI family protein [Candidatus Peregrinibacteria bacterium]